MTATEVAFFNAQILIAANERLGKEMACVREGRLTTSATVLCDKLDRLDPKSVG